MKIKDATNSTSSSNLFHNNQKVKMQHAEFKTKQLSADDDYLQVVRYDSCNPDISFER